MLKSYKSIHLIKNDDWLINNENRLINYDDQLINNGSKLTSNDDWLIKIIIKFYNDYILWIIIKKDN